MSKSENEIITVSQSSGLASCFSTLLYFYIKAKEEFNFVFAPIDGAEAELLRKGKLNPLLGCMMVSPVYIKLYHRTNQQIKTKPTVYMRLRTRLGKARQLEGKGEGGGGNACAR